MSEVVKTIFKSGGTCFPVVNGEGRMTGIISANDIRDGMSKEGLPHEVLAKDLVNPGLVPVFWRDTLKVALDKMEKMQMDALPVVHEESPDQIATMLSKNDILSNLQSMRIQRIMRSFPGILLERFPKPRSIQTAEEMYYFNKEAKTLALGGLPGLRGDILLPVTNLI